MSRRRRPKLNLLLMSIGIALVLLVLVAGGAYVYAAVNGISARGDVPAVEQFLAKNLISLAIPNDLGNRTNPVGTGREALLEGQRLYSSRCSICHGKEGLGKTEIGSGLYPPPPDLTADIVQNRPDGEIFYIIRNGVRFTGMPYWDLPEEQIWHLVRFVKALPESANIPPADSTASQNGSADPAPALTIQMTDTLRYDPEKARIPVGATVKWTNPSAVPHTVTADPKLANKPDEHVKLPAGAETFDSGYIPPGRTYSRRFTVPGTYVYFCIPHERAGMIGTLIVEPR